MNKNIEMLKEEFVNEIMIFSTEIMEGNYSEYDEGGKKNVLNRVKELAESYTDRLYDESFNHGFSVSNRQIYEKIKGIFDEIRDDAVVENINDMLEKIEHHESDEEDEAE